MSNVVIATGGTGGHVLPAQQLAYELIHTIPDLAISFFGHGLTKNQFFQKNQFPIYDISSAPASWEAFVRVPIGIVQSMRYLKRMRPRLVVGFGSYHAAPVLAAAACMALPMILFEANSFPGRVNRLFSSRAVCTGICFPNAQRHLKGAVQHVALPLRQQFHGANRPDRKEALEYFGFEEHKKTVLVVGGSQGAKKINELFVQTLSLFEKDRLQIVHCAGKECNAVERAYRAQGVCAVVKEFEQNMHYAWAAADCCIARSGASTIAEQIAFGVPALFIPYPFAQDNHQETNARWAEEQGGAHVLLEHVATPQAVWQQINELLDSKKSASIKNALFMLQEQLSTKRFANLIIQYVV